MILATAIAATGASIIASIIAAAGATSVVWTGVKGTGAIGSNHPPTVQILSPSTNPAVEAGIPVSFQAAGSDLQYVLRCGVFLVEMRDFEKMNAVYARVFGDHRPARTTVQVAALPDPSLRVEIDAIAYRP